MKTQREILMTLDLSDFLYTLPKAQATKIKIDKMNDTKS